MGFFVKPTVFVDVTNDMEIAREEIFGPVLSVIAYDDEEDAIRIANDSPYGLQAYVFSSQTERAAGLAPRLEAGTVLINRITPDLLAPFGGGQAVRYWPGVWRVRSRSLPGAENCFLLTKPAH